MRRVRKMSWTKSSLSLVGRGMCLYRLDGAASDGGSVAHFEGSVTLFEKSIEDLGRPVTLHVQRRLQNEVSGMLRCAKDLSLLLELANLLLHVEESEKHSVTKFELSKHTSICINGLL